MKVKFGSDSYYRLYRIIDYSDFNHDLEVELTDEECKDFNETMSKFRMWQDYIGDIAYDLSGLKPLRNERSE